MISAFVSRKPWAATIVALVLGPTLGMFYLGAGRNGFAYLAVELLAYALPFSFASQDLQVVQGLFAIAVKLVGASHCYIVAKKLRGTTPASWFARWYSIIGISIAAVVIALMVRSFAYETYSMAAGSMKPTLLIGDNFFVSKYAYGYSRHSLPFSPPVISGRIFFIPPERGDLAVFKLPRDNESDYTKRIVGLPGDSIQLINGVLIINGEAVGRERIEDYVDTDANGKTRRMAQFVETLPNGRRYRTLDLDFQGRLDNTGIYMVPAGHYFALGDNRDNSLDSRVAANKGGVGFIPAENLIGKIGTLVWNSGTGEFRLLREP